MGIPENIAAIQQRIHDAARQAGRDPAAVQLMAVSKTFPATAIHAAYAAGIRVFGENRVQEFGGKYDDLAEMPALPDAQFHLIGHLQTNKANRATELFDAVDSVDALRLADKLNSAAERFGKKLSILIEINVGGEAQKGGLLPDSRELEEVVIAAPRFTALEIRGLMCIPPHTDDPEGARPYFHRLRELRDRIIARQLPALRLDELSMGMSHDFEVAIAEGSTCVRLGTAIFGDRKRTS